MDQLNKHAPTKKKLIRANNSLFMNKTLSKAIMNRSRFKNRYNKTPTGENKAIYNKQRNLCVKLLKKAKKEYYRNIDIKLLSDSRKFWKNIKPFFSEKQKQLNKIILIENELIVSDDKQLSEIFNNFFIETIPNFGLYGEKDNTIDNTINMQNLDDIIITYENHPSIVKIKQQVEIEHEFSFTTMSTSDIKEKFINLDSKKTSAINDIPTKVLKISADIISPFLEKIFDNIINHTTSLTR